MIREPRLAPLAAYIALLAVGPSDTTLVGEWTQVTGQKVVVYAAIATVLLQSIQARRLASRSGEPVLTEVRRS